MLLLSNPVIHNSGYLLMRSILSRLIRGMLLLALTLGSSLAFSEASETFLLDQFAPSDTELERWSDDGLLVMEFGQVAEFKNREVSAKDKAIRNTLELECAIKTFVDCSEYIKNNRQAVLAALPDNPRYWELFWKILRIPTLVDFSLNPSGQMEGYGRLVDSSYWWFYRELVNGGRLDINHAIATQQAAQNWSTGHQTLIARVIGLAIQGIVLDQMSFAMAQASHNHNKEQLDVLVRLLQPPKLSKLSWGPVLWVEQEWQLRSIRQELSKSPFAERDIETARIDGAGLIEEPMLRLMIEDPEKYHRSGVNFLAAHYLPISTMPWNKYWQEGVHPPDEEAFAHFLPAAVVAPAYVDHIVTERIGHFQLFLFSALSEMYSGKTSPGQPALPAPDHWRWSWVEEGQPKLCLVAEDIHPSTIPTSVESAVEICVEYYDAAASASFHRK